MNFWETFWFLAVWGSLAWYIIAVLVLGIFGVRDIFQMLSKLREEE